MQKSLLFLIGLLLIACNSEPKKQQTQVHALEKPAPNEKYILKASNSQFVTLGEGNILIATQTDPTKAVMFERIYLGDSKCLIKASNGKFVSVDTLKNASLYANKDTYGKYETFELIALDEFRVYIKSVDGHFVCSDQSNGNILIANRLTAGEWESFDLIKQN